MEKAAGTLEKMARELATALAPLRELDVQTLQAVCGELGITIQPATLNSPGLNSAIKATARAGAQLPTIIQELIAAISSDDSNRILAAGVELIAAIGAVVGSLEAIDAQLPGTDFGAKLIPYLIIRYLEFSWPTLSNALTLLGVVDRMHDPGVPGDPTNPPRIIRLLHLERLGTLLHDPLSVMRDTYRWGDPGFDGQLALQRLRDVFSDIPYLATLSGGSGVPQVLSSPLFDISLAPAPGSSGLRFVTHVPLAAGFDQGVSLSNPTWTAILATSVNLAGGTTIEIVPPANVTIESASGTLSGKILVSFVGTPVPPIDTLVLIGETGGSRLQAQKLAAGAGFAITTAAGTGAAVDPVVNLEVGSGQLIIDTSHSDGFISKLLSGVQVQADFDLAASWQLSTGLRFHGSAGIELETALAISLGPVDIDRLHIGIGIDTTGGITFELSLGLSAAIGPLQASVERIGAIGRLTFPATGGNLGRADFAIGFKPPTGLGIVVNAGPVQGGGFIEFDPDNGRYAGVLALSLYSIQVKAIGLLDTKLPGGESGYSFLVIISVEFTPIQLGFGFTLNGVGGLCGINRNFVTEAIQAGLRQHSLDHILFPKDPVKNAPAIISDLRAIFPPAEGRYVFGPMLELGWGGGLNLVTAELGVMLSLPSPVVIAILGQFSVNLPNPAAPAVELHLDVLGIIDFGKKLFSLDASLHDSRIVIFTIYGDMAMRLSWGDNPSFALSIGGLNPHFQPPVGFPTLKRLTIALSATDNFRLTIQTYFAITSNTFQLGAHAELYIGVSAFNVYGWLGFDALIIFSPFSFIVDFTAGLALRSGTSTLLGISIDGQLSGPTPWHAKGNAHVTIIFFEISVHVDVTWGEKHEVTAPAVDAWPQLRDAIANVGNWSGALPASVPTVVTLATPPTDTTSTVLVDPNGTLTMRERVLPLNQTLTKFGEAVPGPQNTFTLEHDHVLLGGQPVPFTIVRDKFAPAQFEQLSDQDKLSRSSFEDRDAGFALGDGQITIGTAFGVDVVYADIYVDDKAPPPPPVPLRFSPTLLQQLAWALSNAAATSALHASAMGKYAPPATANKLVTLDEERFVVATTTDFTGRMDISRPTTKGEAYQALAAHLSTSPHERELLQVVPMYELAP